MLFVEYLITPHYFLRFNINYPKSSYCNITMVNLKKAFVICLRSFFWYISMKIDKNHRYKNVHYFARYKNPFYNIFLS